MKLFEIGDEVLKGLMNRGMDGAIVLPMKVDRVMIRFSNNKIDVIQNWSVIAVNFLCTLKKRRLIGRIGNITEEGLKRALNMALNVKLSHEEEFEIPKGEKLPRKYAKEKLAINKMMDSIGIAIDSALKEGAERVAGIFDGKLISYYILSSNGAEGYDERTSYELNIRAFRGEMSGQGLGCSTSINGINAEKVGRDAGWIVREGKEFLSWNEGKYRMLIGPIIAANLLESLITSASAFYVDIGFSCLANKIGKKIVSEKLTIIDDGSLDEGPNSRQFDDEGIITMQNKIIDNGILMGYLHNSKTAFKFKTKSTGNAGWIAPHPWNILINSGDLSFEEALELVKNGIFVVSNWYTRFQNYSIGDFSTICRDGIFLIEGGEIKGALKGVRISENLLRIFNSVLGICKNRNWIKWWEVRTPVFTPAMVIEDVRITKAQGY
ncbi:MAG: TldD/PmbA family protein [Candidatus Methanomethyliaceae archaeon]|nr:TldD/PmbA family protein [Candidatus Methanomethyliaceae archaeon]MDW7970791.1 TldD/PmbA family protein [Nitrososphaerota archaeon]